MAAQNHRAKLADKRRADLIQLVTGLNLLPSTYAVPIRILQLHRSGTAAIRDFADTLAADPGLASKILAMVNSAAFKPTTPITRLGPALTMIGMNNLLPLVFGFSLGGIFNKLTMPAAERSGLWKASLLKAVTARALAGRLAPEHVEEAFLGAMMQDVALPVLYASDRSAWPETAAVLQLDDVRGRYDRERSIYGIDHSELGGIVAAEMKLPPLFQTAIAAHHGGLTDLKAVGHDGLARVLDVAASLPHRFVQMNQPVAQLIVTKLKMVLGPDDPAAPTTMVKQIGQDLGSMLSMYGDADESSVVFKEFLQSLGDEISRATESAVRESTTVITSLKAREGSLLEKVKELQEHAAQSDYDSLTKCLNRRGLMPRAVQLLSLARDNEIVCAVGFADMDHLKLVNDTHGHVEGDAALAALANRLQETIANRGIFGRTGGDEFAILLFGKDPVSLEADIDRIRAGLGGFSINAGAVSVALSASVGFVSIGIPSPSEEFEKRLQQADEAMYRCKRAARAA